MNIDLLPMIGGALNLTAALLRLISEVLDHRRRRRVREARSVALRSPC